MYCPPRGCCQSHRSSRYFVYPETARFYDSLILDEPLGYRLPPGMRARFWDTDVKINQLGMRDREVPSQKELGERRVLLIGDSVVFGVGVDYRDSIPYRLEVALNSSSPPGRHYRTLNMGVPSYNTEQEFKQLQTVGVSLLPDIAVLIFLPNDIEQRMWVYEKRKNLINNLGTTKLRSLCDLPFSSPSAPVVGLTDVIDSVRTASGRGHPRWESIADSLRQMNRLLAGIHVPLVVVMLQERSRNGTLVS